MTGVYCFDLPILLLVPIVPLGNDWRFEMAFFPAKPANNTAFTVGERFYIEASIGFVNRSVSSLLVFKTLQVRFQSGYFFLKSFDDR